MKVIFGAGGVAREVSWLLDSASEAAVPPRRLFVEQDSSFLPNSTIDGFAIVSENAFFKDHEESEYYVAVGLPAPRHRISTMLLQRLEPTFPTLCHPGASIDRRLGSVTIGMGAVIYPLASITTGVSIGDFVHINPGATIGHQSKIGSHTTLCPGCHISGNVEIGAGCFIGAGAVIKEAVRIAPGSVIGAGAVVVSDIDEPGTWTGVPARRMRA